MRAVSIKHSKVCTVAVSAVRRPLRKLSEMIDLDSRLFYWKVLQTKVLQKKLAL